MLRKAAKSAGLEVGEKGTRLLDRLDRFARRERRRLTWLEQPDVQPGWPWPGLSEGGVVVVHVPYHRLTPPAADGGQELFPPFAKVALNWADGTVESADDLRRSSARAAADDRSYQWLADDKVWGLPCGSADALPHALALDPGKGPSVLRYLALVEDVLDALSATPLSALAGEELCRLQNELIERNLASYYRTLGHTLLKECEQRPA